MQQLAKDTTLQSGKYKIEKVLGQGGFGITYLATQNLLNRKVCIKEFFFKEYCERDETTSHITLGTSSNQEFVERFMMKFIKEARTISQLDHPNIIQIYDIFKENNTAYYVMEYVEGYSLENIIKAAGIMPEAAAVKYVKQIADALNYIHDRKINHLDIKPSNIMVRSCDDQIRLIDFGLSKQYDAEGGQTSTTPVGISHGYAPLEQYNPGGVSTFSPATDIYSLGATFFKLITGETPPNSSEILEDGIPELPSTITSATKEAIKKSMVASRKKRLQSIKEFLEIINKEEVKEKEHSFTFCENMVENNILKKPIDNLKNAEPIHAEVISEETKLISTLNDYLLQKRLITSNSIEFIDLGLSVKWANLNYLGDYNSWCVDNHSNLPSNISATEFDFVYTKSNGEFRLPTYMEWKELEEKCIWEWNENEFMNGYIITGPNGQKIFLPACGKKINEQITRLGLTGYYWTSNKHPNLDDVYYAFFNSEQIDLEKESYKNIKRAFRPVKVNNIPN